MSRNAFTPMPIVGERVELARYTVTGGERILYGQRIDGVVRVTDRPLGRGGRAYLVERGLERDGYSALKALVADYTRVAEQLNEVPMATSLVRYTVEQEAANVTWLEILVAELARTAPSRPSHAAERLSLQEVWMSLIAGLGAQALERIERIAALQTVEPGDAQPQEQLGEAEERGGVRRC